MDKKNYEELKQMLDKMQDYALGISKEYIHAKPILDKKPKVSDPTPYTAEDSDMKDFKEQTKYVEELDKTIDKVLDLITKVDDVARHRILHSKSVTMDELMEYND